MSLTLFLLGLVAAGYSKLVGFGESHSSAGRAFDEFGFE
jgi:hypothetical protein